MNLKPYTVILLYPDFEYENPQSYLAHVEAPNPEFAVREAQEQASEANEGQYSAEDFLALYVFEGHIDSEWSQMP